jgi:hypothetical protein
MADGTREPRDTEGSRGTNGLAVNAWRVTVYALFAFLFWRNFAVSRAQGQPNGWDAAVATLCTVLVLWNLVGVIAALRKWWAQHSDAQPPA